MKERVLVVDDSEVNLKLLRYLLEDEGFEVLTEKEGSAALDVVRESRPDVVLLDLNMPGMDGWELTRRLRENPDSSNVVIIAVTAYAMAGDRERVLAAGCDEYVAKPIDTRALAGLIADCLSRRPKET
jgi:CheY-like chemotaxis protein